MNAADINMLKRKVTVATDSLERLSRANQPREFKSPEERQEFKNVEFKADAVFKEFGTTTAKLMEPHATESPFEYRRRVAQRLAAETKQHRNRDISSVPPSDFLPIEAKIYADALEQSRHPLDLKFGQFREVKKVQGGREFSEFVCGARADGSTYGTFKALYAEHISPPQGVGIAINGVPAKIPYVPT